jgi:putative phage-type endonuclease
MTIQTVYLEQGSPEWHEHRAKCFNASEAGAVMGVGKFKPRNMAELLALRRGELVVYQSSAMTRGNELEPIARAAAESELGVTLSPTTMTRGRYSASLDGLTFEGTHAIEIKCPVSVDSPLFGIRTTDDFKQVAPHYWWQVVHQFYVAGLESIAFCVYHPDRPIHIGEIARDEAVGDFDALCAAWEEFGRHLDEGTSPETDRTDDEWCLAASDYIEAKAAADKAAEAVELARSNLIALGGGKGFGLSVTRVKGRKTTDYAKAIKQLSPEADLTEFTKVSQPTWRIQETK